MATIEEQARAEGQLREWLHEFLKLYGVETSRIYRVEEDVFGLIDDVIDETREES